MELTSADQTYIRQCLQEGMSVDDAADALNHYRARLAVQQLADDMAARIQHGEYVVALRWAPLVAPLDKDAKPEVLTVLEDGTRLELDPQRAVHHVKLTDLQEFCSEHGLVHAEILKLIQGEIKEHRGWNRGRWTGAAHEFGKPFLVRSESQEDMDRLHEAQLREDRLTIPKVYKQPPTRPEPVQYQPKTLPAPKETPNSLSHFYTPKDN